MRLFTLIFFAVITALASWSIYLYLSGEIYLKPDKYTWIEGKNITFVRHALDECESDILIQIQGISTYFNIGADGPNNPCYLTIEHLAFAENKEQEIQHLALQIKKWQAKKISEGQTVLPNPYVKGLKIDGKIVFTIEGLNQITYTYWWVKVLVSCIFLFIGIGGLYMSL